MRDRVALLKTPRRGDPYLEAFRGRGYRAWTVPVLRFVYEAREELARRLDRPGAYAGLIATSPRAVEAINRALGSARQGEPDRAPEWKLQSEVAASETDVIPPWRNRPFYAAGPETARRARVLGFEPIGAEAGSAAELAERIVADRRPDPQAGRPLLFLAGNRRRDDLPDRLAEARVPMEELIVYRSELRRSLDWTPSEPAGNPSPEPSSDAAREPTRGPARERRSDDSHRSETEGPREGPIWIVFFSPSGLEAVTRSGGIPFDRYRCAAIGPTTAEALREAGRTVAAVAEEPTPEALLAAIASAPDQTADQEAGP